MTEVHLPLVNRQRVLVLVILGAIVLSLQQSELFRQDILNLGGWASFWQFVTASLHPDLSRDLLRLTADATLTTLGYAVCGTCLSLGLGVIGGILCSEVWWSTVFPTRFSFRGTAKQSSEQPFTSFWLTARAVLAVPRAIHELIWGLIFIRLWGLDPLTAVLAIALPFGAITAKVFSELLDETPRQPLQVLLNSGVGSLTAFLYGLLPQAVLNLLSYSFYRFECSIRSAAVLGIIGAGGLGYQILLSLQSLQYEQLWTFFYALIALNGCVDFGSAWLRRRLGCSSRLDLNLRRARPSVQPGLPARSTPPLPERPQLAIDLLLVSLAIVLLVPFCFWYVHPNFSKLWLPTTGRRLVSLLQECVPPDWQSATQLLSLSSQTVAMSVLAITLAGIGGTLLSFPAAHTFFLPGGILNPARHNRLKQAQAWVGLLLSRLFLLVCRSIPAPVWALVLLFILFPGVLPGAIALGLHNLGILGRLKAEVVENLDTRPLDPLKAQGTPNSLIFLYGVLPLTASRFLAYDLYRWEVCMRETVIVGLVGAGGLGRVLTEQISSFDYRGMVVTLSGFLLLTFGVDWLSAIARRSLR